MDISSFLSEDNFIQDGNLYLQKNLTRKNSFENAYVDLRRKEKRIFSDEELKFLPDVATRNPLYKEWQLRKASATRIAHYLAKHKANSVLEIGCGNGWLSHYLAEDLSASIVGVDVNETELQQASRVFENDNLKFVYADVLNDAFNTDSFDIILIASSIQYFKNIKEVLEKILPLLHSSGELHIIDSPFYNKSEIAGAKERTKEYFKLMGHSEMAEYYFHHSLEDFRDFKHSLLYNPRSLFGKVSRKIFDSSGFPWIRIRK